MKMLEVWLYSDSARIRHLVLSLDGVEYVREYAHELSSREIFQEVCLEVIRHFGTFPSKMDIDHLFVLAHNDLWEEQNDLLVSGEVACHPIGLYYDSEVIR